jgi:hypothetical protein
LMNFRRSSLLDGGWRECLIVFEINTTEPLRDLMRSRKRLRTLDDCGTHFEPRRKNSIYRFIGRRTIIGPASLPFSTHTSYSYAGKLHWRKRPSYCNFEALQRLIRRVTKARQVEAFEAAQRSLRLRAGCCDSLHVPLYPRSGEWHRWLIARSSRRKARPAGIATFCRAEKA